MERLLFSFSFPSANDFTVCHWQQQQKQRRLNKNDNTTAPRQQYISSNKSEAQSTAPPLLPQQDVQLTMSFFMGPILLAARKPWPPQHSLQCCMVSALHQVAAAFTPLLITCSSLPCLGSFAWKMACRNENMPNLLHCSALYRLFSLKLEGGAIIFSAARKHDLAVKK